MISIEKQILFEDLSARLPYGVKVKVTLPWANDVEFASDIKIRTLNPDILNVVLDNDNPGVKPYLRPMSSMTERERKEFDKFCVIDELAWKGGNLQGYINQAEIMRNGINWLNANHFDHSGLIQMGLADEAPEGMYN